MTKKSLFDGVPVDDKAFPLNKANQDILMIVVGHCPTCNAPIYGPEKINHPDQAKSYPSCKCLNVPRSKSLGVTKEGGKLSS